MTFRAPLPHPRPRQALAVLAAAGLAWAAAACGPGPGRPDSRALSTATSAPGSAKVSVEDDFNGDGYADLAIGAANFTVDGVSDAGYVVVLYGSAHGLSAAHRTVVSRATPGVPGEPVVGGLFGSNLSRGDLDGDGYADLVIGSQNHTDSVVVWGGRHGLSGATAIPRYRSVSATGDFNGDHHTDVVLFGTTHSMPEEPHGTDAIVWYGPVTRAGRPSSTSRLALPRTGFYEVESATAADVDHDGRADLALTANTGDAGEATELYSGGPSGLRPTPRRDVPQGGNIVLGDVNGDGFADVVSGDKTRQRVVVAYGSAAGVTPRSRWTVLTPGTPGIPGGGAEAFGGSLAVGDFTGDGIDDIAVGAATAKAGRTPRAGGVVLVPGRRDHVTGAGARQLDLDTPGVPGTPAPDDYFGVAVRLLDTDADGHADLAVSSHALNQRVSAVWLLCGSADGPAADDASVFRPKDVRAPEEGWFFGVPLG